LLGDGRTARFTPTAGFFGLGNFQFAAESGSLSLTDTVIVLVSPGAAAPPLSAFEQWQVDYFGSTTNPAAVASADADGDGMTNTNEFLAGMNPTNSASAFQILATASELTNIVITWLTAGGRTNVVQAATGDGGGGFPTNFADISAPIAILGSGDTTTNYTELGGATLVPSRYYRVRLWP
jgi:hypothetical protein